MSQLMVAVIQILISTKFRLRKLKTLSWISRLKCKSFKSSSSTRQKRRRKKRSRLNLPKKREEELHVLLNSLRKQSSSRSSL